MDGQVDSDAPEAWSNFRGLSRGSGKNSIFWFALFIVVIQIQLTAFLVPIADPCPSTLTLKCDFITDIHGGHIMELLMKMHSDQRYDPESPL